MTNLSNHNINTIYFVASELYGALTWLMNDLSDSGDDRNPETGEMYGACGHALDVLSRARDMLPDICETDLQLEHDALTARLNEIKQMLSVGRTTPEFSDIAYVQAGVVDFCF